MSWTYSTELHVPSQPNNRVIPYAHGLEVDSKDRLYLTYWDWNTDRRACLVRWEPNALNQNPEIVGNGHELAMCKGGTGSYATDSVHGIRRVTEPCLDRDGQCEYLYHANNNQGLFKSDLDGKIIWAKYGHPGNETDRLMPPDPSFTPTWFDKQPESQYLYLADGYGSSKIYVYDTQGKYQNIVFDGTEDGGTRFHTPHAISWDPRFGQMVVSDRTNKRLVYYNIDKSDPKVFKFSSEEQLDGQPCNVRFWNSPDGNKLAVVPTLEGLVYVFNGRNPKNSLVHTINVTKDMGLRHGHDDPHDAIFTKAGDIVVGTYADGYVGHWTLSSSFDVVV